MASVESVKAVGEIMSPVGGIVTAVNNTLEDAPGTINTHPESQGYFHCILTPQQPPQLFNHDHYLHHEP